MPFESHERSALPVIPPPSECLPRRLEVGCQLGALVVRAGLRHSLDAAIDSVPPRGGVLRGRVYVMLGICAHDIL